MCVFLCFRVRCHVVHLSSSQALPVIQEAKKGGAPLTVETTHHYLSLSAENVPAGATQFKCCPPIRSAHNQVESRMSLLLTFFPFFFFPFFHFVLLCWSCALSIWTTSMHKVMISLHVLVLSLITKFIKIFVWVCVCVWWGGGEGYWPHSVNDYLVPQDQLWAALKAGHIDMVVSDHSPCTTDLKKLDSGDFTQAWGGISSLQFGNNSNRCILEAVQP